MPEHYRPFTSSLRSRLLILTVLFMMVISVFVYVPAIATYRQDFLEKRMENAQIAALALEEAPNNSVSPALERELLNRAGVISVIMRREEKSLFLGFDVMPEEVDTTFDLRNASLGMLIMDAFDALEARGKRIIRVTGSPMVQGTRWLEVTVDEAELYRALTNYSNNVLALSIVISLFTGILVYLALHWLMVRPMRRVKDSIVAFRRQPEAVRKASRESVRGDEIGLVERELSRMQDELRQSLKQKSHLAALGEAVAKINHDLRNILSTAQLASDAIAQVDHPGIEKVSRRLVAAVSRAVALCESTIRHGKADDPEPEKAWVPLQPVIDDVALLLGLNEEAEFNFDLEVPEGLTVLADAEQLHRVLLNLCRNARDVQAADGKITVSATKEADGSVKITVADAGPGIPDHVLPNLFKAFTSARAGGTGLGLATARDIMLAHGGMISLERTGADGTAFTLCLPGEDQVCDNGGGK